MTASMPPGWTEQSPVVEGEVARWRLGFESDAELGAALLEDARGRRGVRLSTGPGTCMPATASSAELYFAALGLLHLGDWLATAGCDPEPSVAAPDVAQPTLFDEVTT